MKRSTAVKAGLLLTTLACAASATAVIILLRRKHDEEVYHEAELKAMDELEDMMRQEPGYAAENGGLDDAADTFDETVPEETKENSSPQTEDTNEK